MIKAIFFDVDGTLIDMKNGGMPESTLEALNILLSVIFSVNIVVKRKDNKISFGKMYICCFKALALIYIIFLFSAFIEVQILPKF